MHKADLATSVEKSARLLSTTRGTKDRFKVRGCRSGTVRTDWLPADRRHWLSLSAQYPPADSREDIPWTKAPQKADMVDLVPTAPINYSQMRSDVKRFQPMGREAGMLDVVYNIDTMHKASLSTVRTPARPYLRPHLRAPQTQALWHTLRGPDLLFSVLTST
jgi:hypothetical protein